MLQTVTARQRFPALKPAGLSGQEARLLFLVIELAEDTLEEVSTLLLHSPLRIRGSAVSEVDPSWCQTSACALRISCSLVFARTNGARYYDRNESARSQRPPAAQCAP